MSQGLTQTKPLEVYPLDRDGNRLPDEQSTIRRLLEDILVELQTQTELLQELVK